MDIVPTICFQASVLNDYSRWHARLGHIGVNALKTMIKHQLTIGIPELSIDKETCTACLLGKHTRQPFPNATSYRAEKILELVHGDICGPITPQTAGGCRYIFVLIDDHSRYMWSILLQEKSEAFEKFKRFKAVVEGETKEKIRTLRTDRGRRIHFQ